MAQSVRVTKKGSEIAEELHSLTGESKASIVESALEAYRHEVRMRLLNESYQQYKSDENRWKKELKERKELEGTLGDGLENEQ